jgi:LAGLIDADG endonuclease
MPQCPACYDHEPPPADEHGRLLRIGWITGFVDGEGCFSINFIRQPDRRARKGYRTGFQVGHEFAVTQGAKSVDSLHAFVEFFGIGDVYQNTRYDNHKEHLFRYCVRRRVDLVGTIIPFFTRYPLQTSKQGDFQKFAECLRRMETGVHLTMDGLIGIIAIAETMNHCKPRTDIMRVLHAAPQTPDLFATAARSPE